jgi:hypothetical protein
MRGNLSWYKIKINCLKIGVAIFYFSIAPADCLQYFTAASGTVKSFNWQDVAGGATRQLNNQNYNICFRSELLSSQVCIICCSSAIG